jgi:hypothetical protein
MNKRIYRARARPGSWGLGETGGGNPQIAVEFEILTPDTPEKVLTWYGHFTEASADRTIESLRHMGWTGNDFEVLEGLDTNEVDLVVEEEDFEGKVSTKVQWVNRVGGVAIKTPLAGDKLKSFAAAMRGRIQALDAAGGRKPAAAKPRPPPPPGAPAGADRRPEPPPLDDADLPF